MLPTSLTGLTSHTQTSSTATSPCPTWRRDLQGHGLIHGLPKAVVDNVGWSSANRKRVERLPQAGTINESVEVQANAIALDTETSAVTQTVTQRQVEDCR